MSAQHIIRWQADRQQWSVYLTGEFARYCASFDTLAAAEEYVCGREPEVET
jgi:hypothetical protein